MHPSGISITDYTYSLPDERIAMFPLEQRDHSKLLIYNKGSISENIFSSLPDLLNPGSTMVFNNTRVLNARLHFQKTTGGWIEIFCLEPTHSNSERGKAEWNCLVGGASKWKQGALEKIMDWQNDNLILTATVVSRNHEYFTISFSWSREELSFEDVLAIAGTTPLPPYIKREATDVDSERYQTVYAKKLGSVAAPTAGLHFTEQTLDGLQQKYIRMVEVTLNVGAGTFKPVEAATMKEHQMHAEWIDVSRASIENIIAGSEHVTVVGTTTMRTLETLYWLGVKKIVNPEASISKLGQWEVYEDKMKHAGISMRESLQALLDYLNKNNLDKITASTELMIAPGYEFKVCRALITNFHQPQSTLLLLVAAATGNDWKRIYDYALQNDFRFLSYGDSSLLFISDQG